MTIEYRNHKDRSVPAIMYVLTAGKQFKQMAKRRAGILAFVVIVLLMFAADRMLLVRKAGGAGFFWAALLVLLVLALIACFTVYRRFYAFLCKRRIQKNLAESEGKIYGERIISVEGTELRIGHKTYARTYATADVMDIFDYDGHLCIRLRNGASAVIPDDAFESADQRAAFCTLLRNKDAAPKAEAEPVLAIFDMDGLLLDTERIFLETAVRTAKELNLPLTEENVRHTIGMNHADTVAYYRTCLDEETLTRYMAAETEAIRKTYAENDIPLKKGAVDLLTNLNERGIPCVVATSTSRPRAEMLLHKTELMPFFCRVFCGDEVENGKPSPDLFLLACSRMSFSPKKAIVFEDSVNGLLAADAAGIRCILVPDLVQPTEEQKSLAFAILNDLTEVIEQQLL